MKRLPSAAPSAAITDLVPTLLLTWMAPLRGFFTAPVWDHVLVLVAGAVLAPGKRTVTAALRIMGLQAISNFTVYHQVLNRARWSSRAIARHLLILILDALVPDGPVVIGLDDTIERRWGHKIAARGIYRDPVRSSKEHFVKTSGLRWLSLMVLAPVPWAGRVWALPFLTVLAPSERYHADRGRRHKTLTDWARQAILCVCRWLPDRSVIMVGDSSFAAVELIAAVRSVCTVISRLRLDANLFAPPPERQPGHRGRPAIKGPRLPKLGMRLTDPRTVWSTVTVTGWYGEDSQTLQITSDVAVWYRSGLPPVPIRWVLVRDPSGERQPQAFFSTDTTADPTQILAWFVRRWQVEVTFEECRAHLGVETQRQWSDRAILRTTPALFGLYSLVTLWATTVFDADPQPRDAAWYDKTRLTFSDAIATVRYRLWLPENFLTSTQDATTHKIPATLVNRLVDALCYAA
jgi:hypothetical protein